MKKNATLFMLLCLFMLLQSHQFGIKSSGAPPSSTGAPSEVTCAQAGCHSTYTLNTGNANTTFSFGTGNMAYTPGQTYPITVRITDTSSPKFGFQVVALRDSDNSNVGTFSLVDNSRTQIINGGNNLSSRKYVTYTALGQFPQTAGQGEWTVNWTAPSTDVGAIQFYVATVAADGDETDDGDNVYAAQYSLSSTTIAVDKLDAENKFDLYLYPNPTQGYVTLNLGIKKEAFLELSVVDLLGKQQQLLYNEQVPIGSFEQQFFLDSNLPPGVYLLKAVLGNQSIVKPLFLQ